MIFDARRANARFRAPPSASLISSETLARVEVQLPDGMTSDSSGSADLFAASPKVTAERLKDEAEEKAKALAEANPTRVQLVEKLEKLVAEYNAGALDAERFFAE